VPDPRHGVFETLLVLDGRPVELDAHLARLEASLAELFPGRPAPDLGPLDTELESGVMRIDIAPDRDLLEARISFREPEDRVGSVALRSLPISGGLGPHKWADRSLLDEAQTGLPAGSLPLVVDEDGAVLEASRANVFTVRDGALLTPPLDGRILPGITRMRVLEIAEAMAIDLGEEPLTRNDLISADDVFLTGSVRGIEWVDSLDGTPLGSPGEIGRRLTMELQLAWANAKTAFF